MRSPSDAVMQVFPLAPPELVVDGSIEAQDVLLVRCAQKAGRNNEQPNAEDHLEDHGVNASGDPCAEDGQRRGSHQQGETQPVVDQATSRVGDDSTSEAEDLCDEAGSDRDLGREAQREDQKRGEERGSADPCRHRDRRDEYGDREHEPVLKRHRHLGFHRA